MLNIALLDDDPLFRASLEKVIHFQPDIRCLINAGTIREFWDNLTDRYRIHLFFIDIDLPDGSGLDTILRLKKRPNHPDVVMLTRFENPDFILKAIGLGASGYLLKDFDPYQLVDYIKIHRGGGALISPKVAKYIIHYMNPPLHAVKVTENLSVRQEHILRLIAEGNSYEEIAAILDISVNGVRYHIKTLYEKLGATNKIQALSIWENRFNQDFGGYTFFHIKK
jgi:DNA-binding NarL/FixJ family response regulator